MVAVQNLELTRTEAEKRRQEAEAQFSREKEAAEAQYAALAARAVSALESLGKLRQKAEEAIRDKDAEIADIHRRLQEEKDRVAAILRQQQIDAATARLEGITAPLQLTGPENRITELEATLKQKEEEKKEASQRDLSQMRELYMRTQARAKKRENVGFPQLPVLDIKATADELYMAVQDWKQRCNDMQAWTKSAGTDVAVQMFRKKRAEKRTTEQVAEEQAASAGSEKPTPEEGSLPTPLSPNDERSLVEMMQEGQRKKAK